MREPQKQLNIRISPELYEKVQDKCKNKLNISMSTLIKVFLQSFVSQEGVGFYIGEQDLKHLFNRWLLKKEVHKDKNGTGTFRRPRLKDLYDL